MNRPRHARRERGFALWLLLFAGLASASFLYYLTIDPPHDSRSRDQHLARLLTRAKEALIARAVNDLNRPGSLPCPDLLTDSEALNNRPGDGKADMLAGNHCPSYVGWLPWLALDLPELLDATGNPLWYALSPALRDDDSAQPINSASRMTLKLDADEDIAAIVIAAGPPLADQARPSNSPADYLESRLDADTFRNGPASRTFNDRLLAISGRELMAAVEKRVAGELKACIERHVAATANGTHRYPWPVPLASQNRQSRVGTLFGRVPDRQPGTSSQAAWQATTRQLAALRDDLRQTAQPEQQLALLAGATDAAVHARNQASALLAMSDQLADEADILGAALLPLAATIGEAVENGRISRSEGSTINALSDSLTATFEQLPNLLEQFGIDAFPAELSRLDEQLRQAGSPSERDEANQAIRLFLNAAYTARPDLAAGLAAARQAAAAAVSASPETAAAAATELGAANNRLLTAIAASRINLTAAEISDLPGMLESLRDRLGASPGPSGRQSLQQGLTTARTLLDSLETGIAPIAEAGQAASGALLEAYRLAQVEPPDYATLASSIDRTNEAIRYLAGLVETEERNDGNLARSSLQTALDNYRAAYAAFAAVDGAAERPRQSDIVPYASALATAAADIERWADAIARNSRQTANLIKAPGTVDETSATDTIRASADSLIEALNGKKGVTAQLLAAISTPNRDNRERAETALAEAGSLLETLIAQSMGLANSLSGTRGSAQPVVWDSLRCDFLMPGTDTWWHANRWADLVFYQIAGPFRDSPANLQVNQTTGFRLLTIAAGRELAHQSRATSDIAAFLEDVNADPSRNGEASAPSRRFVGRPPGRLFNDRLAY